MTETATALEADASAPPREDLFRALAEPPTLTRTDQAGMPTLTGHFAVFDQWTEIQSRHEGHFLERLAASSMDKTIAESRDRMRVLFNHGQDSQIGDKVLGPISVLEADATGARYEVPLLDTSYNRDLVPALEAGLYGASFRFQVLQEEYVAKPKRSDYNPDGLPERTILEARVREFGPVTFPAYQGATAGLRSLTDRFMLGGLRGELRELVEEVLAERVAMPAGMSMMPAGVKACQMSGSPGFTGGAACHSHDGTQAGMAAAMGKATTDAKKRSEPEPSGATTHPEPEPSAATTRAQARKSHHLTTRKETPSWHLSKS